MAATPIIAHLIGKNEKDGISYRYSFRTDFIYYYRIDFTSSLISYLLMIF